MRHLRVIGGSLALAALLIIAGALWAQSGNGRYQVVTLPSGGLVLVDTRSGRIHLGSTDSESARQQLAKRWMWTPISFP
jgi:hypothetical protein